MMAPCIDSITILYGKKIIIYAGYCKLLVGIRIHDRKELIRRIEAVHKDFPG